MNLGEVKAEFSALLNRRDATPEQKTSWMRQGIERVQRVLRIPAMEKAVTFTVGASFDGLTIPSDYILLEKLSITLGDGRKQSLVRKSIDEVEAAAVGQGFPEIFARRQGKWVLGPTPTEGMVIRIDYGAEFEGVEEDEDENAITIICPTLIIYASLSYAGDHFNDKRTERWEGRVTQIKDELHEQAQMDELSGGAEVSPAYAWPDDE